MIGLGGLELPQVFLDRLGPLAGWLQSIGVASVSQGSRNLIIIVPTLLFFALFFPNTIQVLARYEPALGVKPLSTHMAIGVPIEWNASVLWAIAVSILVVVGIMSLGGPSEFLYWQF
jgi:hypothetical protein